MEAILLAGGLGTRLRSVVKDRPKPMADVEGKPFLLYLVEKLKARGVTRAVMAVGYKGEMIRDFFGDGSAFGLEIDYAWEKELLGTAGAIRNAAALTADERVLVLNADTYYEMPYDALTAMAERERLDMALVLRAVEDVSRYGEAVLTEGRLTAFDEKTGEARPGTINGGVYCLSRNLLDDIPEGKVSLEHEMIPRWMAEGRALGGMIHDGYFIDIGVPEDYARFCRDVREKMI